MTSRPPRSDLQTHVRMDGRQIVTRRHDLVSARLRLRPVEIRDLDDLHDLWTDALVRRYLWDDQIIPRERAAAVIDESVVDFDTHGFGIWVLLPDSEEALGGFCGLRRFGDPPAAEILYGLAPRLWHRGLATEAAVAVLRFGFDVCGLARIHGRTDPPNEASIRVLERLGMDYVGRYRESDEGPEIVDYAIGRESFRRRVV